MKILLATDGSAYAEDAVKFLTKLCLTPDDEIMVLHVITWVPFKDDRESHNASIRQIKHNIAPRILDSSVNILSSAQAKISTALEEGYPDRTIVAAAVESGADLIVMGARGLTGINALVIGSVTRSVAINSLKSVLVTKGVYQESRSKLKVLFATDGSGYSDATMRLLTSLPFPDNTEVTILNVMQSPLSDIPERFILEIDDRVKQDLIKARTMEYTESEKILEHTGKYMSKRFLITRTLTKVGDPYFEILHEAEMLKPDIIAVGSSGMRGVKGILGSVSRDIVIHSPCSVLIGKKD